MKMKKLVIYFLAFFPLFVSAQTKHSKEKNDDDVKEQGVELYIGAGVYMGSKKCAKYYNGGPENVQTSSGGNTLGYIFGNQYRYDEIKDLIIENNKYIPRDSKISVSSYPKDDMRYSPAMLVQLGARYRFNSNWSIAISYSFARLKAKGSFFVTYSPRVPGNDNPEYLQYGLQGTENRSLIELTGAYTFETGSIVKPFIEFGGQFNYVRVKKFQVVIEGREYDLIDRYGGSNYVPGLAMQTYDVRQGGSGFGICGAVGLKLVVSKMVSLDPVFYVSGSKFNLPPYNTSLTFNYGAAVRISMMP
ncbi:MAG: hypothetical protein J6W84_02385 [Bacteroidales bacterium]|nr:hypothetical protein [Bacteroidales bacterium]